jgi:transposase
VETNRTSSAPRAEAVAEGWASPRFQPASADGDCVCAADGCSVAGCPWRNELWQWQHMLAAICRMDSVVGLDQAAHVASFGTGPCGKSESRSSSDRQCKRPRGFWGGHTGPNPTDRAKKGCKRHVLTDAQGLPLVVRTTPANTRDDQVALQVLVSMPAIPGRYGRPRIKPRVVQGDAGYGFPVLAALIRMLGVRPQLAPRGAANPHGSGLGKTRYVVERTLSWFGNFRRLKFCYERTGDHFQAFHELAAAILCAKRLTPVNPRF